MLMVGGLVFLLRKPLRQFFGSQNESFKNAAKESQALFQEAETLIKEYSQKLTSLNAEVARMMDEAKTDGEKERQRILARAKEAADQMIAGARLASMKEAERIERELRKKVIAQAILEASDLLKSKVTEKEHCLFTEELMMNLEAKHG